MDRETMTTYGLLTLTTLLMALLIGISTPLGTSVVNFTETQINTLINNSGVTSAAELDGYGTLTVHYCLSGAEYDLYLYKATLKLNETCKIPVYSMPGYKAVLYDNGIETDINTTITIDQVTTEKYVIMIPDQYSITYYFNGGEFVGEDILLMEYTYGAKQKLTNNVEKDGYKFIGWYTDSGLGGQKIEEIPEGHTGNIVLYAKYAKI